MLRYLNSLDGVKSLVSITGKRHTKVKTKTVIIGWRVNMLPFPGCRVLFFI